MEENERHERFMRLAIAEALAADPILTRPNPRVGAVIVENGEVVASGRFEKDGGRHAERAALETLGRMPDPGASLYVTLEPCSTEGRTGACTSAVIEAELKEVVVGALDPTLAHRGSGLNVLRAAGVGVVSGVLASECESINPGFRGNETGER